MACCEKDHPQRRHQHHSHERGRRGDCCRGGAGHRGEGHFRRRYHTREEKREDLESYLADLRLEVQAVEERLEDIQKASGQSRKE